VREYAARAGAKTVAFYTLGCKVNQYDTEAMREAFLASGYSLVDFEDIAAVYVINTCTVTARGDAKSRQAIRRARRRNPKAVVAVTGCYPQVDPGQVTGMPEVDVVAGTNLGSRIVALVEQARRSRVMSVERQAGWPQIAQFEGRTRALLKIQEGCRQFCSYCIVPYARGPSRSRPPDDVLDQVRRMVESGFKEIVLTGVHLGAYGADSGGRSLAGLLRAMAQGPMPPRLRLSSIEPVDLDPDLFDVLREIPAFCEHLHVPLQSGSRDVLKEMKRPYCPDEFRGIVDRARSLFPDIGITTDIIVGFPGETEKQFRESLDFVESVGFSRLHVFRFSPRPGTAAASLGGRVGAREMGRRSDEMIRLGRSLSLEFHTRFVERTLEVLVEEYQAGEPLGGFTRNYIRTSFPGDAALSNQIVAVRLEEASPEGARGTALP
jgi:threonylcarbamoyladenosine tRNA methylthiotransferase MtaB